jgi:hypothetical protein
MHASAIVDGLVGWSQPRRLTAKSPPENAQAIASVREGEAGPVSGVAYPETTTNQLQSAPIPCRKKHSPL